MIALWAAMLSLIVVAVGGTSHPAAADRGRTHSPVVWTDGGAVRGVLASGGETFLGVPYAAPPVGDLRWRAPQPAPRWRGVRDATAFGPSCPQQGGLFAPPGPQSEDCLSLNVYTPEHGDRRGRPRPVIVWIHGGGLALDGARNYDPTQLAAEGTVVVTINYRLGALGFLAHPALGRNGDVGNYGLADQQAALRWVRDNIANFGGDPDKVTIAGESAGAMAVCDHLVAPGSAGLFRAAILQSGPCQAQLGLPEAQHASLDYAREVGCGDPATAAACLRALPADKLREPVWYYGIGDDKLSGPVTGTAALPVDPMTAIARGDAAKVPVVIGTNRDEFTLFVALEYLRGKKITPEQYPHLLSGTFGGQASAVAERYPLDHYGGNASLAYSAAVTDSTFACVADRIGESLALHSPVYAYEFNDRNPPTPDPLRSLPFPLGASHSLELRYLFDIGGAPPLDPAQQVLSDQMIDYWAEFVTTGAPDVADRPDWPQVGAADNRMSLQPGHLDVITGFDQMHQCPFWASLKG
jgi:para-nitrobenzyl esterase